MRRGGMLTSVWHRLSYGLALLPWGLGMLVTGHV